MKCVSMCVRLPGFIEFIYGKRFLADKGAGGSNGGGGPYGFISPSEFSAVNIGLPYCNGKDKGFAGDG
jgi:hypothetical protein